MLPTWPQPISSGLAPRWSALGGASRASIASISAVLAMKASSAFSRFDLILASIRCRVFIAVTPPLVWWPHECFDTTAYPVELRSTLQINCLTWNGFAHADRQQSRTRPATRCQRDHHPQSREVGADPAGG